MRGPPLPPLLLLLSLLSVAAPAAAPGPGPPPFQVRPSPFFFPTLPSSAYGTFVFRPPGLLPVTPRPTAQRPAAAEAAAEAGAETPAAGDSAGAGPLRTVYAWRQMDFSFPSAEAREAALASGEWDPTVAMPLGLEAWGRRLFVTLPRWRAAGTPATLAWVPRDPRDAGGVLSPQLTPYPDWSWHGRDDCEGLTSVYRVTADQCGRLWVLDSGAVDAVTEIRQQCPPKLLLFDLRTDRPLLRLQLPAEQLRERSLFSNLVVDVRAGRCEDAYAYLADVWRYGIVVVSLAQQRSWRVDHPYFYPDPLRIQYRLRVPNAAQPLRWSWPDGVFGLALDQEPAPGSGAARALLFNPMSSSRQFAVSADALRAGNITGFDPAEADAAGFQMLGEPRGRRGTQAGAAAMDRRGVLFYALVGQNAVGCWNSRHPAGFLEALQGRVARDDVTLVFPNDLKVDTDAAQQSLWVLTNRLPGLLYGEPDWQDVNFRVLTADVESATRGTVCDPQRPPPALATARPPPFACES